MFWVVLRQEFKCSFTSFRSSMLPCKLYYSRLFRTLTHILHEADQAALELSSVSSFSAQNQPLPFTSSILSVWKSMSSSTASRFASSVVRPHAAMTLKPHVLRIGTRHRMAAVVPNTPTPGSILRIFSTLPLLGVHFSFRPETHTHT